MKALIIYSSKTGNTKKVAYGIYENLKDSYDLSIKDMDEINDMAMLDEYDTLVIGFWIDRGTAHPKAKKFVKQIKNKKIALFATLGADPSSKHGQDVMRNLNKLADKSNALLAVEIYNGLVDPALLEKLKTLEIDDEIDFIDILSNLTVYKIKSKKQGVRSAKVKYPFFS